MVRIGAILLILIGIGGLGIFIPLALGGFEILINFVISKQLQIIKGKDVYELWKKPPIPIYFKAYIFNLTNPLDIENGSKPILQELGPYVYIETLEKLDITPDNEAKTIRYRQVHNYYFQPQLSKGSPEDVITFINIPFLAVAKMAHDFTDVDFLLETLDGMLTKKGEGLTKSSSVREFLFDGFSVQAFLDMMNDPMVEAAGEVHVPDSIKDGKMGLLKGKNGTSDGWWVVKTGEGGSPEFNKVISWESKTKMSVWKDESCNSIIGTDGMMYAPFMESNTKLSFFIPQMCRSLSFINTQTVDHEGMKLYRYKMDPIIYQTPEKNPNNWCFCPHNDTTQCNLNGIFTISPCAEGAPLYISNPHFCGGDDDLINAVIGLNPVPEKHVGYFDIHPKTAMSVHVRHRFQFNMKLKSYPAMPTFAEAPEAMLPLMWIEEGADVDDKNKGMAKILDKALGAWSFLRFILILIFIAIIALGIFLFIKKKSNIQLLDKKLKPDQFINE